jgi:hypothetical protein
VNIKGEQARPVCLHPRFTRAEAKALVVLGDREDRSAAGVIHWVVRAFLRGELAPKKRGGGR